MNNRAILWLTREELDLIIEGLETIRSDYEGTYLCSAGKWTRIKELEDRLIGTPGYKGSDNPSGSDN
jgi:hypothetical protein